MRWRHLASVSYSHDLHLSTFQCCHVSPPWWIPAFSFPLYQIIPCLPSALLVGNPINQALCRTLIFILWLQSQKTQPEEALSSLHLDCLEIVKGNLLHSIWISLYNLIIQYYQWLSFLLVWIQPFFSRDLHNMDIQNVHFDWNWTIDELWICLALMLLHVIAQQSWVSGIFFRNLLAGFLLSQL